MSAKFVSKRLALDTDPQVNFHSTSLLNVSIFEITAVTCRKIESKAKGFLFLTLFGLVDI